VPAYASSGWLPTPEAYGEEAQHFRSLGWTAYKIHPHAIPRNDIKICQAVRKAVGDDMVLMLDSMWSYGYEDAVRVGRAIEALDYFWYEDPLME
jgi:L-alanine-DL-glutamate epimerase-like enolase superfamily enzyme